MDNCIMIMLKFKDENVLCRVEGLYSFNDFIHEFHNQWPDVLIKNVSFHYSLGSYSNVALRTQMDFNNMILMANLNSIGSLNIDATEISQVPQVVDGGSQCSHGVRGLVKEQLCRSAGTEVVNPTMLRNPTLSAHGPIDARKFYVDCSDEESDDLSNMPVYDINPTHNERDLLTAAWGSLIEGSGQVFGGGAHEFRQQLIKYCFKLGFDFKFDKNTVESIVVSCPKKTSDGCKWSIRGCVSSVDNAFRIMKANLVHTCQLIMLKNNTKRFGSDMIANFIIDTVRTTPSYSPTDVVRLMKTSYGIDIKYGKARRSIEKARARLFGSYEESFQDLEWYSKALIESNPGSWADIEADPVTNRFDRIFIAFRACLEGFKHCRPLLFVDGTFMKSRMKGTLLSATAKDGNQREFTVPYFLNTFSFNKQNYANMVLLHLISPRTCTAPTLTPVEHHIVYCTMHTSEYSIVVYNSKLFPYCTELFPVAFAVVTAENKRNWLWFLKKLKDTLNCDVLFISDRNVGLMEAFEEVFDNPKHFFCLYHLFKNLRSRYPAKSFSPVFKNALCYRLKECAYAPTLQIFEKKLLAFVREGGQVAADFIRDLPYEKWAISHSNDNRYGELTSNAAESFNKWILEARGLPVTHMVDCIRIQIMKWFCERREMSNKWNTVLCKRMDKIWNCHVEVSSTWHVKMSSNVVFEVFSEPSVQVNIRDRTCSCFQWQVLGFPCCHAAAVIRRYCPNMEEIIDPFFLADSHRKCYSGELMPVPTTGMFTHANADIDFPILPPESNRLPGRPHKRRLEAAGDDPPKKLILCTRCRKFGKHNKRSCREAVTFPVV